MGLAATALFLKFDVCDIFSSAKNLLPDVSRKVKPGITVEEIVILTWSDPLAKVAIVQYQVPVTSDR